MQAAGLHLYTSKRPVRFLSLSIESPFTFRAALAGAGSTDKAKTLTSEAADAAVGFGSLTYSKKLGLKRP